MRKVNEITLAIAILLKKGDEKSLIMADTLQQRLSEQQVFQKYVVEVADSDRNETVFFAARDAARYLAGHLELNELIPEAEYSSIEEQKQSVDSEEMVQVPLLTLQSILLTIKELDTQVRALCGMSERVPLAMQGNDLMELKEVLEYIGCGATSLRRWIKKGVLSAPYRKGSLSYFSKQELDSNPVIQRYMERR